ncbi:MAG: glycosyltransferase family 4 protein [Candidimonas sp.]
MIVIHSLRGGGAERVAADISAYWIQRGYMVTVVTQMSADSDRYPLQEGVTRYVLGTAGDSRGLASGIAANLRRVWRLRRLIKRERPTIVLGMMTTSSVLALTAAQGLSCRVIASEHTHPPSQSLSPMWQRWRRWAYPKAKAVVALTGGTAQWLEENVPGSRVAVIPNSVAWPLRDTDPVVAPPEKRGRKRLLAVGRLHPVKGFDTLIRAFSMLAWHYDDWDLIMLGEGEERDTLQRQIDDAGMQARISLPGRVGNMADWYRSSDLYVLSSVTEGLSNTLLESMACGLPVVAFDCDTGPREIVRAGIDGVLVRPVRDAEALAAHLSDMMAHPEKRQAYGRRAIDVRDRFSTTRVMALWGQLFEQ